jgi:hypothetical protein
MTKPFILLSDPNSSKSLVGIENVLRPVRVKLGHDKVATKVRRECSEEVRRERSLAIKALVAESGAIMYIGIAVECFTEDDEVASCRGR